MHNPYKLKIYSNRSTKNIKMINNAVENANLCGKICDMRTLPKCAKYAAMAIAYSRKTDVPSFVAVASVVIVNNA